MQLVLQNQLIMQILMAISQLFAWLEMKTLIFSNETNSLQLWKTDKPLRSIDALQGTTVCCDLVFI